MKIFKIILKALKYYLPFKYSLKYKLTCVLNLFGDLLELIGISFFPIIIYNILNPKELENFLHNKNIFFLDPVLQNESSIIIIIGCLVLFYFLKNIYLLFVFYFQKKLMIDIEIDQRSKIYQKYLKEIEYEEYLKKSPSYLYSLVDRGIPDTTVILDYILLLIREVFLITIIFVSIFLINIYASIITLISLISFVIIFYFFTAKIARWRGKISWIFKVKNAKIVSETFDLFKEIRLYNKDEFFFEKYKHQIYVSGRNRLFLSILNYLPRQLLEIGLIFIIFLVICFSFYFFGSYNEIMPSVTFIAASSIRLIPAFRITTTSINDINYKSKYLDTIVDELELLKSEPQIDIKNIKDELNENEIIKFENSIKISNLRFKFKGSDKEILNISNLEIKKGEKIGIIGPSGSGKSSLINLILGFLKPSTGEIKVDGKNIKNNLLGWSKNIGYVPQEIFFLDDKISNNIAFGVDEKKININKLKRSLEISNLVDFVNSCDAGVDTVIGNKALKISGGQRQRIGIARAIYNTPSLLILDEATNSLDEKNEVEIINDIILNKDLTIIIIAHRLECLKNCDKIFKINNGKLITHNIR